MGESSYTGGPPGTPCDGLHHALSAGGCTLPAQALNLELRGKLGSALVLAWRKVWAVSPQCFLTLGFSRCEAPTVAEKCSQH